MPSYLIAIAIGPVQDFIAAARRTRDLWFGSHLLAQLSHAALEPARKPGFTGTVIFPSLSPDIDAAGATPNRAILQADVDDPAALCQEMGDGVRKKLTEFGDKLVAEFDTATGREALVRDRFDQQLQDLVEFYAAWVPFDSNDQAAYIPAYRRLQVLMAARKTTREFIQTRGDGALTAKSSLDAARETVLSREYLESGQHAYIRHQQRFGIDGDALDAPGLLKRVLGRKEPFDAVSRVALEPWIKQVASIDGGAPLRAVSVAYGALVHSGLATRAKRVGALPYDGQLLLIDRLQIEINRVADRSSNTSHEKLANTALQARLRNLKVALDRLMSSREDVPRPDPYVALLSADADRMGDTLWNAHRKEDHKSISRCMATFAAGVPGLVQAHGGTAIYVGGDDVLAMLPVPTALACARKLHDHFAATALPDMTISVGIGIGHALTPLASLRRYAEESLQIAKRAGPASLKGSKEKDALAVLIQSRGGGPLSVRENWDDGSSPRAALDLTIEVWLEAMRATDDKRLLPRNAAHLLAEARSRAGDSPRLLRAEVARFIKRRSRDNNGPVLQRVLDRLPDSLTPKQVEAEVLQLEREWLAARWLLPRTPKPLHPAPATAHQSAQPAQPTAQ